MNLGEIKNNENNNAIGKLLKQNINAFEQVNTKEIFDADFHKIKHSPFYKDYKEAIRLAKMIFKRLGFSLNALNSKYRYWIYPFKDLNEVKIKVVIISMSL